jgi:hypothetical protein
VSAKHHIVKTKIGACSTGAGRRPRADGVLTSGTEIWQRK